MEKINCALIGPGNIGTDLLYKLKRSKILNPAWMIGIDAHSDGLKRAEADGLNISADGVDGLISHIENDNIKIIFDATSAKAHEYNWNKLKEHDVRVIDLTPAGIGKLCVPSINLNSGNLLDEHNLNMISCGGQATTPIVYAINKVHKIKYAEVVASMSSKSVGPGSRQNLDEVIQTSSGALTKVSGAQTSKILVVVNPAEPPMLMRNTITCIVDGNIDKKKVHDSLLNIVNEVHRYVPGYRIVHDPIIEESKITVYVEVEGAGDYLPKYAGNLDIMTAAACRTGELIAERHYQ